MPHQIAYLSTSRVPMPEQDLEALLLTSRNRNARDGITGLLLYHDGLFFQVLEGDPTAVAACYARIEDDSRHGAMTTVLEREVERRAYPDWSMGYLRSADLSPEAADAIRDLRTLHEEHGRDGTDPAVASLVRGILSEMRM